MIYPRKIKNKILKEFDNDLIIVILGMRRVGKTYLLYDLFNQIKTKNKIFLDLEKPEDRQIFNEENLEAIINNLKILGINLKEKRPGKKNINKERAWIFLDEIQYLKKIPSILKFLTDHYQIKFIVTGSSSFYLKNLFYESLAGRKIIFNLYPLDFGEFLIFRNKKNIPKAFSLKELTHLNTKMVYSLYQPLFEEYITTGGFPQAVLTDSKEKIKNLLLEIINSYIFIDIKTLANFKEIENLEKLIYLLPSRIGQKLEISKLASEINISRETTKNYLSFLENTFIIQRIKPFSLSPDREISAIPKLYFIDNGLSQIFTPISEGQILENIVFSHLLRKFNFINYYQKKSGPEIDFIIDKKIAVEVKSFADQSDYRKLKKTADFLKIKEFYLFSKKISVNSNKNILPIFLLGFLN